MLDTSSCFFQQQESKTRKSQHDVNTIFQLKNFGSATCTSFRKAQEVSSEKNKQTKYRQKNSNKTHPNNQPKRKKKKNKTEEARGQRRRKLFVRAGSS